MPTRWKVTRRKWSTRPWRSSAMVPGWGPDSGCATLRPHPRRSKAIARYPAPTSAGMLGPQLSLLPVLACMRMTGAPDPPVSRYHSRTPGRSAWASTALAASAMLLHDHADAAVLFVSVRDEPVDVQDAVSAVSSVEIGERHADGVAYRCAGLRIIGLSAAFGLGNDGIGDACARHVRRRELHRRSGLGGQGGVIPKDRRAPLGRHD